MSVWTSYPFDRPAESAPAPAPASVTEPDVLAVARPDVATWVVPATPAPPAPVVVEAPAVTTPEVAKPPVPDAVDAARARIEQEAQERAAEQARLDRARQEAQRQAEQAEATRQAAARKEAARAENARLEAERQEAVRQAAARQEAARQEAARQEAARLEVAKDEARREAVRRALGRQLDEEAARREPPASGARLPLSVGSARRARLFGRIDPNAELVKYGEDWSRKIQMNMTFEMVREAAKLPHTNPTVTVAVRKDGSVESVAFVVSSGVAALDEAIRRVVHSQEHYPAFPPGLAREYDVIEIRRTWHFDMAIRLY